MEYKNLIYGSVMPFYSQESALKPRNIYDTGIEESLEKIVLHDEPDPGRGMVDRVFSDKSRTLKATIKALFNEITIRERLDSVVLREIDSDICKTDSHLEQIREMTRRQYTPDLELAFSRRRTQLESQVLELNKEKRQEYVTCFKDLSLASRYLLSALKDYWNLSNRKSFLNFEDDRYRGSVQKTEAYNWG